MQVSSTNKSLTADTTWKYPLHTVATVACSILRQEFLRMPMKSTPYESERFQKYVHIYPFGDYSSSQILRWLMKFIEIWQIAKPIANSAEIFSWECFTELQLLLSSKNPAVRGKFF